MRVDHIQVYNDRTMWCLPALRKGKVQQGALRLPPALHRTVDNEHKTKKCIDAKGSFRCINFPCSTHPNRLAGTLARSLST